jgi:hypothetical protein
MRTGALLAFTKLLFVGAEAALRVARECAFSGSDQLAVGGFLLYHHPVVIAIA